MRTLFPVIAALVGCSEPAPAPASCVPGAVIECPCGGGVHGAQTCLSDGTFGTCRCSEDGSVVAPDTAEPEDTATAPMDSSVADSGNDTPMSDTTLESGTCPSSAGCVLKVPLPTSTFPVMAANLTICPDGAKPTTSPPQCILEIDLGKASWMFTSVDAGTNLAGSVPMRVASLPITISTSGGMTRGDSAFGGGTGCPATTFMPVRTYTTTTSSSSPRPGCDATPVSSLFANSYDLEDHTRTCGVVSLSPIRSQIVAAIRAEAEKALRDATTSATCRTL